MLQTGAAFLGGHCLVLLVVLYYDLVYLSWALIKWSCGLCHLS